MTPIKKIIIFCSVAAVLFFIPIIFRSVPSGNLWKGYRIVYVDETADEDYVADILKKAGCESVISLASQGFPVVLPVDSVERSLALSFADEDGYLAKRRAYFFDRGNRYRLYYIEDRYEGLAEDALRVFRNAGVDAGLDTQSVYPFIVPLVCIAFALLLCILSSHRLLFFVTALFPISFAVCVPFYSAASAGCLLLYALFIALRLWRRRGAFSFIKTDISVITFSAAAFTIACVSSLRSALLFTAAAGGIVFSLFAFSEAEKLYEVRYRFRPVPIRPAREMPLFTKKIMRGAVACASSIAVFFAASLFSTVFAASPFSRTARLEFPSAAGGSMTGSFPTLNEYVAWCWNTKTAPYRSIYEQKKYDKNPKDGDSIAFPRFTDSEQGISSTSVSMIFDKNFSDAVVGDIDALPYPAVEKLLKAQGENAHTGYAFSVSGGGGFLHTLLIIFALCMPSLFFVRSKLR